MRNALMDLHLHLDGSLSVRSVMELAAMQKIQLPEREEELCGLLQVSEDCRDLNEYLEKFEFPLQLLQTKEAIARSVYNLKSELEEQGLLYAEIRFAPQLHMREGLSQEEVVIAALKGLHQSQWPARLILCCMRGRDNHEENLETVRVAAKYLEQGVVAVDLAGAEALFPTAEFVEEFALARDLGVPFTIHAGEADGPDSIRKALEFGASRIGHGVRSVEDPVLLQELAEKKIPLELCPTSNLNTCIYSSLADYPLRKLMDAGVCVTLNTDNTTVSHTCLQREFTQIIREFDLTEEEVYRLNQNAVEATFADEATKTMLKERIFHIFHEEI